MAKFSFFLLAAMCLAQGWNVYSAQKQNQKYLTKDCINKGIAAVAEAFHKAQDSIDALIEKSRVVFEDTTANLIAEAKVAIDQAIASIKCLASDLDAEMEKLLKEAEAQRKGITKWVEGKVEDSETTGENAIETIKSKCQGCVDATAGYVKAKFENVVTEEQAELDVIKNDLGASLFDTGAHHTIDEANEIYKSEVAEIEATAGEKEVAAVVVAMVEGRTALDDPQEIVEEIDICIGKTR